MKALVYPLTTDPTDTRVAVLFGPSTDKDLLAVVERDVPPGRTPLIVDVLTDRTFRDAWKVNGDRLEVDMMQARVIHMNRIRRVRDKELERLDKEWMKALGQGQTVTATNIEAERQALRDLPQRFDLSAATTPEALQARWPSQLPRQ